MTNPIRVLVVDDSAFMRKTITGLLSADPGIQVIGEAADGLEAIEKVKALHPDIITMDIEMPRMNGLDALKTLMREMPLPVIMVSSLTAEGAKETIKALEYGAADYIPKNLSGNITNIVNIKNELITKVKLIGSNKKKITRFVESVTPVSVIDRCPLPGKNKIRIVVIGASTGGPKALQDVLPRLPKNFPAAVLVIQHMLPLFTSSFAVRMNELSQLEVREAKDGDLVKPGTVLVAPGGYHLKVKKWPGDEAYIKLAKEPQMLHMPSVDIAMESVAHAYSEHALGVIMTGMGQDGKNGIKAIKDAKGKTISQDEETSIIFGMPKAAIESGCIDKVVSLSKISEEIVNML